MTNIVAFSFGENITLLQFPSLPVYNITYTEEEEGDSGFYLVTLEGYNASLKKLGVSIKKEIGKIGNYDDEQYLVEKYIKPRRLFSEFVEPKDTHFKGIFVCRDNGDWRVKGQSHS